MCAQSFVESIPPHSPSSKGHCILHMNPVVGFVWRPLCVKGQTLLTWIEQSIYAAGGQHIPAAWADFADSTGIGAILHLSSKGPEPFLGPPPRRFLWLMVEEEKLAGMDDRRSAAEFIKASLAAGEKVLLHSAKGRHRTRWAYVAYGLYVGRRLSRVLREAAEKPWLAPYHTDRDIWNAFQECVRAARSS